MPTKDDKALSAEEMLGEGANAAPTEAVAEDIPEEDRHPILSPEEVRAAREKAQARVTADAKKQAMDQLVTAEMARLRGPLGLTTGDPVKDEMVSVSLDLAEHSDGITINGHKFWHGQTYRIPRHVADTLREVQARGHDHQNELDGKGIADRFKRPRMTVLSERTGAVRNAPQRAA